jgi:hypothetical protein
MIAIILCSGPNVPMLKKNFSRRQKAEVIAVANSVRTKPLAVAVPHATGD